ncbi:MAG: phosphotransferase [Deltaproteobacteria bacterium]|nr:phosphotransferase [Deltaproteobacteria bacterium]
MKTEATPEKWLASQGFFAEQVVPLSGDVSARRYFRIIGKQGHPAILSHYPRQLSESYGHFVSMTTLLQQAGIRVPTILAVDPKKTWMLLEDLGEKNLFEAQETLPDREPYFRIAVGYIKAIQALPREIVATGNPPLDSNALISELDKTWDVFLKPKGLLPAGRDEQLFNSFLHDLCSDLGARLLVPCHRDFMARNLIPLPGKEVSVAVIDYQDLRLGPCHYDLASLLNDSFFPEEGTRQRLLDLAGVHEEDVELYHKAAVQRTLKAVGTFAAFANRGSDAHLPLIAPTLRRALYHLAASSEGSPFAELLEPLWRATLNEFC